MTAEYEFSPIDMTDDYIRSGRSVIVATFIGDVLDQHAIAGRVHGRWISHGQEIDFEPTHYANPRAVKVH